MQRRENRDEVSLAWRDGISLDEAARRSLARTWELAQTGKVMVLITAFVQGLSLERFTESYAVAIITIVALIATVNLVGLVMKAYPVELRSRIVAAVDRGVGSLPAVAALFNVSINCVANYLHLRQQTGSLQPRPYHGGRAPAIPPHRYDEVRQLLAEQPDLTLEQIRDRLQLDCSLAAICRTLKKLHLSRKKKPCKRPNSSDPTCRPHDRSGLSGRRP